jgi:hypothetical protein
MNHLPKFAVNSLIVNLFLLFSCFLLRGQNPAQSPRNLVVNSSFEDRALTSRLYQTVDLRDTVAEFWSWSSPTPRQAKIYSTDKGGFIYDDTNLDRPFKAVTGKNVGMVEPFGWLELFGKKKVTLRSYLLGELKTPLEVGVKYYAGFFLHFHCLGTANIGIGFTSEKTFNDSTQIIDIQPVAHSKLPLNYDKTQIWELVVDSFVAENSYPYLILGNFFSNKKTATGGSIHFGHYIAFVDDIFVIKASDNKMPPPKPKIVPPKPAPPLPKVLNHVQFKHNSTDFEPSSFAQLDSAVLTLQRFPKLTILIKGHTSSEGDAANNQNLSERRAEAVKNYLVAKSIAAERLQTKGFGASQLLNSEKTEADRRVNRRIEFEILTE